MDERVYVLLVYGETDVGREAGAYRNTVPVDPLKALGLRSRTFVDVDAGWSFGSSAVDAALYRPQNVVVRRVGVEEGGWGRVGGVSYGLEGGCWCAAPPDLHQICYRW